MSRTHTDGRVRAGFTFVEFMIAVPIVLIMFLGLASFVFGVSRFFKEGFAEAETSIAMRDFREKLLFRAAMPYNDFVWSGVASGSISNLTHSSIKCGSYGVKCANGESIKQEIDLRVAGENKRYFKNNDSSARESDSAPWFCACESHDGLWRIVPFRLQLLNDEIDMRQFAEHRLFSVYMRYDTDKRVFRQRIVVPEFGREQQPGDSRVFHDGEGVP